MFSVTEMSAKAVKCSHPTFIIGYDVCKGTWENENGHYRTMGNEHKCTNCNYSYWDNLYSYKMSDHAWVTELEIYEDYAEEITVCAVCRWKK